MQENSAVYFHTWGVDNIAYGPVELPAPVNCIHEDRVLPDTWVFREDRGEWTRAAEMAELKALFESKTAVGAHSSAAVHGITPGSLRRMKVFADMNERQLASFLQYLEVQKFLPNAIVFRKGEHSDAMFLVLEGEVRARVMVGSKESTLMTMGVGDCFGEIALLDERPRSADVVANSESTLLKISAGALKRLFQEAPALAAPFLMALSRALVARVRRLTQRYEDSVLFARTATEQ
jgi:hypothetical protein